MLQNDAIIVSLQKFFVKKRKKKLKWRFSETQDRTESDLLRKKTGLNLKNFLPNSDVYILADVNIR